MRRTARSFLLVISCAFFLGALTPAFATEQADIVASLKTLPLLLHPIPGDLTMAIVYDPASPASKADAEAIRVMVNDGIQASDGRKLTALLVGVDELAKLSRAKIAFITTGLTEHLETINSAASAASILTLSTDIDCVKAAKCIIGVRTSPSVEIFFSKKAADAAKIEFSQDFSMLVKQL